MPLTQDDKIKYKALYLQTARPYISHMKDALSAILNGKEESDTYEILHRSAHSLASQSMMMDYTTTGALSRQLEHIFKAQREKTVTLSPEQLQLIETTVKRLADSVDVIEKTDGELDLTKDTESVSSLIKQPV